MSGNLNVNSGSVTVGGSVTATGGFFDTSLRSAKDIYTDATNGWKGDAISLIRNTPIHEGRYKGKSDLFFFPVFDDDKLDSYDPHLINDAHNAIKTYSMNSLSWLAIQNLAPRVETLEEKVMRLEEEIVLLKEQLN